ncbi:rod shape-determining protein MreD [Halonatronum saccharophilum]|uniref:rod shape-determining protein MreD n=1 Tax=Halonatronum saccharophilum TaxID=150060 RepID=UPI0004824BA9|nr:rod shape-determining protein MreD [Halonatronum saccharophilum]
MYWLIYSALSIVILMFQGTIFSNSLLFKVTPDLMLIIIVVLAINKGKTAGGIAGFIIGFLQDLFSGNLFGINAITKTIVGYLLGFLSKVIYQDNFIIVAIITFFATIINQGMIIFFTGGIDIESALKEIIIPLAIYNTIITLIIYPVVYKLDNYLARKKAER